MSPEMGSIGFNLDENNMVVTSYPKTRNGIHCETQSICGLQLRQCIRIGRIIANVQQNSSTRRQTFEYLDAHTCRPFVAV